jgi:hypothetical protein
MRLKKLSVALLGATLISPIAEVAPVQAAPSVCIRMPWQSKDKCSSKLVYAKSNAPKDIKNELERLGAVLDATRDFRKLVIREDRQILAKCTKNPGPDFGKCMFDSFQKRTYKTKKGVDLQKEESLAWLNLYYFAKDWKQYVQPAKYSTILTWGAAVEKCYPNCKYND